MRRDEAKTNREIMLFTYNNLTAVNAYVTHVTNYILRKMQDPKGNGRLMHTTRILTLANHSTCELKRVSRAYSKEDSGERREVVILLRF